MSTGVAKHFALPYEAPEARASSRTPTRTHTYTQTDTQTVCVCVYGWIVQGCRGSIVSDWKAEVLGGGNGKVKGKLNLEHLC